LEKLFIELKDSVIANKNAKFKYNLVENITRLGFNLKM